MTTPIESYRYNNNAQRWTSAQTGRFVSETTVIDEMRAHQDATFATLDNLTNALYDNRISLQQWQIAVAQELKDAHLAQAMFAAGGKQNMDAEKYGRVGGILADQYRYLDNFAREMANGDISRAEALRRIKMYGNASQEAYWRQYVADTSDKYLLYWELSSAEHCSGCVDLNLQNPHKPSELSNVPGDGRTPCKTNCKCTVRRELKVA